MRHPHIFLAAAVLCTITSLAARAQQGTVWKDAGCQCCTRWIHSMAEAGITLSAKNVPKSVLTARKSALGITRETAACHTAEIGGYVVEGHVPAEDVKRLLAERPNAVGLAVPGMPIGSPGMETGSPSQPYAVLLIKKDGSTEVFARH